MGSRGSIGYPGIRWSKSPYLPMAFNFQIKKEYFSVLSSAPSHKALKNRTFIVLFFKYPNSP